MKLTKKMKTLLHLTAFATLIVAFSFNLNASNINLVPEEEAYINDIPFSTEEVAADYLYNKALHETFQFEGARTFVLDIENWGPWEMSADPIYAELTEDIPDEEGEIGKRNIKLTRKELNLIK